MASAPGVAVAGVGVLAAAWAAGLLLVRADGLATPAYDHAFFQQLVWRIGQDGRWLTSFDDGSFLGLHFSPLLVVPALLERILWLDARMLSLLHTMAIGALAPAAFVFVRAALRPSPLAGAVAAGLSLPIPVWAVTQEAIRADFHPEVAGVALALAAAWAALTGRRASMWILAALALAAREDVAYAVFAVGLGAWALGRGRARRRGLVLAVVAVAWAVVVLGLVMPFLRDGATVDTARYYRWLGSGPEVLLAPLRLPDAVLAALTRTPAWHVLAGLVISLAGLPLLRPRWLLLLAPPMLAVLLSAHPPQAALTLHYPVVLVAPALVVAALGGRRALALVGRRRRRLHRARPMLALGIAVPALVVAVAQGSVPPFDGGAAAPYGHPAAIAALRSVAAGVPANAVLFVDEGSAAPLASRAEIRLLNRWPPAPRSAYVLLDAAPWHPSGGAADQRARAVTRILAQGRPVLAADGRFTLLGPASGAGG